MFIHSPIIAPNLTLTTKECNPDKDFITTKPTIQIQETEIYIYDQIGAYILIMPIITVERYVLEKMVFCISQRATAEAGATLTSTS